MFLAGISFNQISYNRNDLFAVPGLFVINGINYYNKNLSFDKKFDLVGTPHFALQKTWKDHIFNFSYSEGYNAPTSATAFITGINVANDDLLPERAKMWDFSVQGILGKTNIDYQFSLFNINIKDKLTQSRGTSGNQTYTYWTNTGDQTNKGVELSIGYAYKPNNSFLTKIQPFVNYAYSDFKYSSLSINTTDHTFGGNKVVGIPKHRVAMGLDFSTKIGLYLQNTYSYMGTVYTDFANTTKVKSFALLNSKIGYKHSFGKFDADIFVIGKNLTNQINYSFLFYGNSINDSDLDNQYLGTASTDVNPGPDKAYYLTGFNLKYNF